ncbi:MAG: HAMP domain-containing sensor histidine kinase [Anaerococcus sp.]|nr:HAMP domain-containing sensor histidine kinase [Anaerococcus sp.]
MTSLRNKLTKNFIAGILACILIYSILISLFVTIRYSDLIKIVDDKKPDLISEWFIRLNNDKNITTNQMWEYLEDLSIQQNVNISYVDSLGNEIRSIESIENIEDKEIKTKSYKVYNAQAKEEAGVIVVDYTADYSAINRLQNDFRSAVIYAILSSLIIGLIISVILSTNIAKPIGEINNTTIRIKKGIYDNPNRKDSDIREISNLQDNISFLSKSLKRQEEIRKKYAQDISHELRTPITNLKLYLEALDDGVIDFDSTIIASLNGEINRLQGLVDGLKDSFNESVNVYKLNLEEVNLSKLMDDLLKGFGANFLNKNIKLEKSIDPDVYIISDRTKLNQIIQNLLTNAIKAIDHDGLIKVCLKEKAKTINIKVEDDGIGIDEDKIEMIFERFFRIDDSRNTKTNGLGLGLAITKNFVEALNGKIEVTSKKNVGTSFTICFHKKAN